MTAQHAPFDLEARVRERFEPLILAETERLVEIGEAARHAAIERALASVGASPRASATVQANPSAKRHPVSAYWSKFTPEERSAILSERRRKGLRKKNSVAARDTVVAFPSPQKAGEFDTDMASLATTPGICMPSLTDRQCAPAIIRGDCLDILPRLPQASVDLIVTSPPYPDHGLEYERPDETSIESWTDLMAHFLRASHEALKPGGSLWVNVGFERPFDEAGRDTRRRIPLTYRLAPIAEAVGMDVVQEVVWEKAQHQNTARHRLSTKSERWLWFVKPGAPWAFDLSAIRDAREGPFSGNPADIWRFPIVNGNDRSRPDHPCPFPPPMIERIVRACSAPGDLIVDPFAGSGTVGEVAERLGRRSLLIEREERYVKIIRDRLAA